MWREREGDLTESTKPSRDNCGNRQMWVCREKSVTWPENEKLQGCYIMAGNDAGIGTIAQYYGEF